MDNETIEAMRQLLEPNNLKLDKINNRIGNVENDIGNLDNRISNLNNRIDNLEYQMKKGFRETRQDIDTLVEVLEAKGILPKDQ